MGKCLTGVNDLQTTHPELIKYWDFSKNKEAPCSVARGSNKKYWWVCDLGHSYDMVVANKVKGQKCPYCVGKRVLKGFNDFATTESLLMTEWDYEKNKDVSPELVTRNSHKKVYWKCPANHTWAAVISSRSQGRGCPYCRTFGTSIPEQAVFFYIEKQFNDVHGRDMSLGFELDIYIPTIKTAIEYDGVQFHNSEKSYKRDNLKDCKCKQNGIRLIRIREQKLDKTESAECIFRENDNYSDLNNVINHVLEMIGGTKQADVENDIIQIMNRYYSYVKSRSLESVAPDLAKEWHPHSNGDMKPTMISPNTHHKVWWICSKGHSYQASPAKRYSQGRGCPYCSHQKVLVNETDFASRYPQLAKEWDFEKNSKDPNEVFPNSHIKYYWKCPQKHDSYPSSIANRVKGKGCPVCAGHIRIRDKNSLGALYPDLIKELHPDQIGIIDPFDIAPKSDKKLHWICGKGHDWYALVKKRTSGQGCPYCSNNKIWPGFNDLETWCRHNNRQELVKEWDTQKNGATKSNMIAPNSNKEVWWICPVCSKSYKMKVCVRTRKGYGHTRCKKRQ